MAENEETVAVSFGEQNRRINEERRFCHHLMIVELHEADTEDDGLYCNRTWDDLMCWPRTRAGQMAVQSCPSYIHGFMPSGLASKQCLENGEWIYSHDFNRTWSNYTQCYNHHQPPPSIPDFIPKSDLDKIKILYNVGYGISLVTLLVAIVIMIYFRRLHCPRNTVHLNLFVSFVLRATLSFLRDNLLVSHLGLPDDVKEVKPGLVVFKEDGGTHWQCKLLFATFNYVVTASSMWIFVEGLYLHTLVIVAVFSERNHIRYYILLGWGGPLIFVLPWVIVRATVEDEYCWNTHPTVFFFWILKTPTVLTIAVNFVFFVNIVRVLFTKLVKTAPPRARRIRYSTTVRWQKKSHTLVARVHLWKTTRRLAKSTLVLIPLFGVHYIVFLGLPENIHPTAELVKLYYEMFFNSFQGFLIACLFCFMNGEVKAEIRKKWIRYKLHTNSKKFQKIYWQTSSSHLTRKHSRCQSRENSSSMEKRDSALGDPCSSSSESSLERRQLRVSMQQMRYNCRSPLPRHDVGAIDNFRPIVIMCKRNSFV